eukprot:m.162552 g.162552  ORF g.162552 m.162552 type:complete len:165 (-) comp17667_c1_seq4:612-1106(-)
MLDQHGFNIGHPDNIVHAPAFLDYLHHKLKMLYCLFCDRRFPDRTTLKSHMRKKKHFKLNPKDTSCDQFYLANYTEVGQNWEALEKDNAPDLPDAAEASSEGGDDWTEWEEGEDTMDVANCLFCTHQQRPPAAVFDHMKVRTVLFLSPVTSHLPLLARRDSNMP